MHGTPETQETEHEGADADAAAAAIEQVAAHELREAQARAIAAMASPLDQSFAKRNNRPQHGGPSVWDAAETIGAPSPTLSPGNITSLEGYDAENVPGPLLVAVGALQALHDATRRVIEARESIKLDPTLTPAAMVIALASMQAKLNPSATLKVDAANAALAQSIAADEAALRAPVKASAVGPFAVEIRQVARSMKTADRMAFIGNAIANGDTTVAGAILGAPAQLSGLDPKMIEPLTATWNNKRQPETAKRLALMKAAEERLARASGVFLLSLEAALGSRQTTVAKLRSAQQKARTVIGAVV